MTHLIDRHLVAQLAIVVAVCIGGWLMVVEPKVTEHHGLKAEIESGLSLASSIDQDAVQRLAGRLDEVRRRVRQIDRRGEISRDSSHLYSVVMDLAREHGVVVASLNPGVAATPNQPSRRGGAPAAGAAERGAREVIVHRELSVSISGTYENIAAFVDALQSLRGYLEIRYLSIAAASGRSDIVNARLTCRTVGFVLPDRLREMLGDDGPQGAPPQEDEGEQRDSSRLVLTEEGRSHD
jgi:Tfp pilus assembly protein PilO